jgi:transposase-like protein
MHRIVPGILSLAQHLQLLAEDPERYRPPHCPHCQTSRPWGHGRYWRKADRRSGARASLNPVAVLRFCCRSCAGTCSRLPECIAPRRWFDWAVQQAVLLLLLTGCSVRQCAASTGRPRRTVQRWGAWLVERDGVFAFFLRSRFAELGRADDFAAFWLGVLQMMSLSRAMAWLDLELDVP